MLCCTASWTPCGLSHVGLFSAADSCHACMHCPAGHALSQTGGHGDMRGRGEEVCSCGAALRGLGRVCDGVGALHLVTSRSCIPDLLWDINSACWALHPNSSEGCAAVMMPQQVAAESMQRGVERVCSSCLIVLWLCCVLPTPQMHVGLLHVMSCARAPTASRSWHQAGWLHQLTGRTGLLRCAAPLLRLAAA